jgi:hypothetical protein
MAEVKARWAEVNQEALASGFPPGQGAPVSAEAEEEMEEGSRQASAETSRSDAPADGRNVAETLRSVSPTEGGLSAHGVDQEPSSREFSRNAEPKSRLQRQLASRYEHMATSLSNPLPTQPIVDLFV